MIDSTEHNLCYTKTILLNLFTIPTEFADSLQQIWQPSLMNTINSSLIRAIFNHTDALYSYEQSYQHQLSSTWIVHGSILHSSADIIFKLYFCTTAVLFKRIYRLIMISVENTTNSNFPLLHHFFVQASLLGR